MAETPTAPGAAPSGIVRFEGEGHTVLGACTWKLRGADSRGTLAIAEYAVPAGFMGPPPHRHPFDETFFVLDGRLQLRVGERSVDAGPGTFAFAPGGLVHGFANPHATPARMLFTISPAGFEAYFDELAAALGGKFPPDRETAARVIPPLMARYGVTPA